MFFCKTSHLQYSKRHRSNFLEKVVKLEEQSFITQNNHTISFTFLFSYSCLSNKLSSIQNMCNMNF